MRLFKTLVLTTALLAGASTAQAQNASHGIAAVVNSDIVTIHDLRQRGPLHDGHNRRAK